jgi:hypothetical protein
MEHITFVEEMRNSYLLTYLLTHSMVQDIL